jgi:hypothetical protein
LVVGLAVVATVLLLRVRIALGRQQARVVIDRDVWSPISPSSASD